MQICNTNHEPLRAFVLIFSSLSVWGVMKKKPLVTVRQAHSCKAQSATTPVESASSQEHWITAVTAFQNSDLVASGTENT